MAATCPVTKRLQSELFELMSQSEKFPGITAFPFGDNLTQWRATIGGPADSYYEDMDFSLELSFPSNYPIAPPIVKFVTPIFHPNIDMSGNICLDILKEKWGACFTVSSLLVSIQSLLLEPNNASPLNNQAAQLWDKKDEFMVLAKRRYENLPIS